MAEEGLIAASGKPVCFGFQTTLGFKLNHLSKRGRWWPGDHKLEAWTTILSISSLQNTSYPHERGNIMHTVKCSHLRYDHLIFTTLCISLFIDKTVLFYKQNEKQTIVSEEFSHRDIAQMALYCENYDDDVIKWKNFRVTCPLCGDFTGDRNFDVSLICAWINSWANTREAGDLRRHRVHYRVIVISWIVLNVSLYHFHCVLIPTFSMIYCVTVKLN